MLKLLAMFSAGIPAIIAAALAFIARKWGTTTATIAMFIFLTAAFIACINALLGQLLYLLSPPPFIAAAVGMFIPSNFAAILGVIISSKICRASYDLAMDKAKTFGSAS